MHSPLPGRALAGPVTAILALIGGFGLFASAIVNVWRVL